MLVFAHMMKTAGTSLSKQLITHFGWKMHMVPGGLGMDETSYGRHQLAADLAKPGGKLDIITGHPMRPWIDWGDAAADMVWFTFMREPRSRYVSHFFFDRARSREFQSRRYASMKKRDIIEWEGIQQYANYQTRFLAGEVNLDKAIEILEEKMSWVGCTEDFDGSMRSFKAHFGLAGFYFDLKPVNRSAVQGATRSEVFTDYADFIESQNDVDIKLYAYFMEKIWPRFANVDASAMTDRVRSSARRRFNTVAYQLRRQMFFRPTPLKRRSFKAFYNRWLRA